MKTIIFCIVTCIAGYYAGCMTNHKVMNEDDIKSFDQLIIEMQQEVLLKVDTIFDNNDIYDADGSDTMEDYLWLRDELDRVMND